ncbi:hypothetical protein LTR17_012615 [Elasticomyces elasticus]|nr:hypothetical protein LTR17_012615 [Elasticomyces elasticus]
MAEQLARQYLHKHIADAQTIFDLRLKLATQQVKPPSITPGPSCETVSIENAQLKSALAEKEECINNLKIQLEMMSESREIEKFNAEMVALQLELAVERVKREEDDAAPWSMLEDASDGSLSDGHISPYTPATSTPDLLSDDEDEGESDDSKEGDVSDGERAETNAGVGSKQQAESAASAELPHSRVENSEEVAAEKCIVLPELTAAPIMGDLMMEMRKADLEKLAGDMENAVGDKNAVEEILRRAAADYDHLTNTPSIFDEFLCSAGAIGDGLVDLVTEMVENELRAEIRIFRARQKMNRPGNEIENAIQRALVRCKDYIVSRVKSPDMPFVKAVMEEFMEKFEAALRA